MELIVLLFGLLFGVGIAYLFYQWGASIAEDKCYDRVIGGLAGVLGGLVGILVMYLVPKKENCLNEKCCKKDK